MKTPPPEFMQLFRFRTDIPMMIGCEREMFLTDMEGVISPLAPKAMSIFKSNPVFGFELSACQLEMKVGPSFMRPYSFNSLSYDLFHQDEFLRDRLLLSGMRPKFITVAPYDMPLDVYPDPTGRYQRITATMPIEILRAACRVAGTHFHIGMPNHETALRVYNHAVEHFEELCEMGNLSGGERMAIYRVMAKDHRPQWYENWNALHQYYVEKGYNLDPRSCWTLIRISAHGTIEFRMFDNTEDLSQVETWGRKCFELCQSAL